MEWNSRLHNNVLIVAGGKGQNCISLHLKSVHIKMLPFYMFVYRYTGFLTVNLMAVVKRMMKHHDDVEFCGINSLSPGF